jgi:hypothetical protein
MTPPFQPRILERYIAIDHACGWPNLTLLPDGDIAAAIWPEPCHGMWEGAAEVWASGDGGRTWAKRGVPVPHDPGTNRMNLSAGLARDGALIAFVSGWDGRPPRPQRAKHAGCDTMPAVPARSLDGGRTWTAGESPVTPADEADAPPTDGYGNPRRERPLMAPFGDIWPLPDGTLGTMLYAGRANFYVSADDGRTWTLRGALGTFNGHNETTWLPLPDGRLLAAARTYGDHHLEQFVSDDLGRTWTFVQHLTGKGEHPAGLTPLADGALLLTYGIRTEPLFGIGAKISRDAGATWSEPQVLVDLQASTNSHDPDPAHRDGGYPANVQLADGTIVTAYYCKGVDAHQRYHVGVLRWRLD